MYGIPQGYTQLKNGPAEIVVKQSCKEHLLKQGIADPERLINTFHQKQNYHKGRGPVPAVPIEGKPGEKMVIRKYLRGGFLRFLNREIHWNRHRSFKELFITVEAASKGVPTLDVLAAVSIRALGPFYREYLITKELTACCDLPACLIALARKKKETFLEEKEGILIRVAETIRLMHAKGFYHGDLNLKNILIDTSDHHKVYIIDWDKSFYKGRLSPAERSANVRRFCRSMAKLAGCGVPASESDQLRFLKTYWQDEDNARKDFRLLKLSLAIRRPLWKRPKNI